MHNFSTDARALMGDFHFPSLNMKPSVRPIDRGLGGHSARPSSSSTSLSPSPTLSAQPKKPSPLAHPIHALPLEILTYIFDIGTQDSIDEASSKPPQEYVPNFEVTVSHVCRYWREVALKASHLWTFISFREVSHMHRAQLYLERSQHRLLDIVIDTPAARAHIPGSTLFRDEFNPVFNIVTPHVHRWRSLVLKVRDFECKAFAKEQLSTCGPAPNLERIELYHLEDYHTSQMWFMAAHVKAVCIFGGYIPRLRNLTLTGVNLPWTESMQFLNDLEVIEFALHAEGVRPTYEEWSQILLASPRLRRLQLHYSGPQVSDDWPSAPIPLPALQDLSICDLDSPYLCLLFRHLSVPAVTRLHLELGATDPESTNTGYEPLIDQICNPARPYFPALTHLHVSALECSHGAWRKLLACHPKLTSLELDFGRLDNSFLLELTTLGYPDESPNSTRAPDALPSTVLCPNVTTMKVKGLAAASMQDFILFRNKHGCPITRWYVLESDKREVRALGIEASVEYFRDINDVEYEDNQWDEDQGSGPGSGPDESNDSDEGDDDDDDDA